MEMNVKTLDDRLDHLDRMIDSVKGNMTHSYETLTSTTPHRKNVTFRLEDAEIPTITNQAGYQTVMTIEKNETEENVTPPPLPKKYKKRNKFAIPTTRPRLKKTKRQTMAEYLEMTGVSAPNKAPQLEPTPENTQVLKPLLAE